MPTIYIFLIFIGVLQVITLLFILKPYLSREKEKPDGLLIKDIMHFTGGYTDKINTLFLQTKFKIGYRQASRILDILKDPVASAFFRKQPIVYKKISADNLLFTAMLVSIVVLYFGISIYFAKKDRVYQNPSESEWLENEDLEARLE